MNKITLIIKREYLTRVRKKSFLIMTFLGPVLFASFMIVPTWLAQVEDTTQKTIAVIDSSKLFINKIPATKTIKFDYLNNANLEEMKKNLRHTDYYGILSISHVITYSPNAIHFFSLKQPPANIIMHISNSIEKEVEKQKLLAHKIDNLDDILKSIKTNIRITIIKLLDNGEEKESMSGISEALGGISGFLIYFFIFLFGAQVMRGVIEEKSNRIIEVIISSVKPFQLMMGKIVGIALVGLTQFLLWLILTFFIVTTIQGILFPELTFTPMEQVTGQDILTSQPVEKVVTQETEKMAEIENIFTAIKNINFGVMIGSFLFFFLGGYLLYSSLFAAVGSAADTETDTQQFMLPITVPLIIAIFVMINTINNPEGQIAFWFSLIPLTSPIVMMVRISFGVPYAQVALSAVILILTFIGTTWLAAKIYRTGILMYGKKVNYRELWKWIRYKA